MWLCLIFVAQAPGTTVALQVVELTLARKGGRNVGLMLRERDNVMWHLGLKAVH